jgi:hypothetical protein
MENECYCNSFNGRANSFPELLKTFEMVASSKLKKGEEYGEVAYTVVLKCKECKSYYLWDSYSEIYSKKDLVLARKYIPKTDDEGLRKVLKYIEGTADEHNIDESSSLLEKLRKIELNKIFQRNINDNKN